MFVRLDGFCSRAFVLFSFLALAGCGGSTAPSTVAAAPPTSGSTPATNPVPALSSLQPQSALIGSTPVTLTLSGSSFVAASMVLWNGTALQTTFNSSTTLTAQIPASDLASASTAQVTVLNAAPGGGTSTAQPFQVLAPNASPTLSGLSPSTAPVNSSALTLTLMGTGFLPTSVAQWNGAALPTTYLSATTLTAALPPSNLASSGSYAVTVATPMPGGGSSMAVPFVVEAVGNIAQMAVDVTANSLAWDAVNQKLYLSLPSANGVGGNTVQALDPVTGTLGASGYAGSEPDLLAVSANSKYVYVGLDGASSVQRLVLPGLTQDINIPLGSDQYDGPYYAGDLQAAPMADGTVAVVRNVRGISPAEEGGVAIYDDGTARPNALCGFIQIGCESGLFGALYDSIQWNDDASQMFAVNNEDTGFDFYTVPVSSSGFGLAKDYGGLAGGFGSNIHFDPVSGYVYDDDGAVINPSTATLAGTLNASGLVVPDGKLGVVFVLGQSLDTYGSGTYTLESFDMKHYTPIASMTISNVVGIPTHMVRWGTNGLAFTTTEPSYLSSQSAAQVYLVSGSFVSAAGQGAATAKPTENVHRSWAVMRTR